ncbi:uncharacterized protein L203_103309 [Cryptococcus depauperatus CBS 7841]|uniref:Uncharacterized protein n=1 Tax=Cryptococcus depauperatus CBS 7841 TaxID=1295531 RepID=A0A1E3I1R6_9TREE|nr:hypothetical protein L203_05342 [Cryptococcus depauperatus CBS 7841]
MSQVLNGESQSKRAGGKPLPGISQGNKEAPKYSNQQTPPEYNQRVSILSPQSTQRPIYPQPKSEYKAQQGPYPQSMSRGAPSHGQGQAPPQLRETSRTNIRSSMLPPPQPGAKVTREGNDWQRAGKASSGGKADEVEAKFNHLLDSLQVPETVREKFATVSRDVKSSILSSTLNSNPTILSSLGLPTTTSPKARKRISAPLLRKTKSSGELKGQPGIGGTYNVGKEGFLIVASPRSGGEANIPSSGLSGLNTRGQSVDLGRPAPSPSSRPSSRLFAPSSLSRSTGAKGLGIAMGGQGEQPSSFLQWLAAHKGTDLNMDVLKCKKLRMLLRHESTDWVGAFIEGGGYSLILDRLQELLDIEWREEQHDDQMLYEILRCVKALSTSEIGKTALRKHFPRPFSALSSLLFSEKKPGDLATRQLIVELWYFLFDLFPPPSRPSSIHLGPQRPSQVELTAFVRTLLVPDHPDPTKEQHEFVTQAHRPRVFKAWVGELSDICRDYFWIMCHASNTLWALDQVDESLVEKPVAPGGATGGVEFEAMNYVIIHFKLLNAFAKRLAVENPEKARQLHYDLMASGMDRILVTFRKASTTYYPTVHLELARYIALLKHVSPNGKLPYLINKMVGPPPGEVRRTGRGDWLRVSCGVIGGN